MDSKQYINKVIKLHDFSIKCYLNYQYWCYDFLNDGVTILSNEDSSFYTPNVKTISKNNFTISIMGHIYEHFINNLCVKKEEFWYLWDKIILDMNEEIIRSVINYRNKVILSSMKSQVDRDIFDNKIIFYLPTSEQIYHFFNMNPETYKNLYFNYVEYNPITKNNTVKEIRLPVPPFPQKKYVITI
jgi:hypothetical protein